MIKKIVSVNIYTFSFLILNFLFPSCANKDDINDNLNISVIVKDFNAWVNLMPGIVKKHSIHISCGLLINNVGKTDIKQLKLKGIKILQEDNERNFDTYSLIPFDTLAFVHNSKKKFSVSAVSLINGKTTINYDKAVKFVFFYSSFNRNYKDTINNILIAKVY